MVARLVRLRIALLASAFRGGFRRAFRSSLIGVIALVLAVGFTWLPIWMGRNTFERMSIEITFTSLLLAAVLLVPIFTNIGDLDVRMFAGNPASSAQVATAMFVSSIFTWPALWLIAWMITLVLLHPSWLQAPWALVAAGILILLLAIAFARVSAAFVRLVVPRRATSPLRWVGLLLLFTALPVIVFTLTESLRSPSSRIMLDIGGMLGWTPFGAPIAGLGRMVGGDENGAFAYFAVAGVTLVVFVALWYLLVARSLTSVEAPAPVGSASDGLEFFERFGARPREVVAARALTYWRRDPRYRVALLAIPLAPVVMLVALSIAGVDPLVLALLPLPVILLLLGWSAHNDVALDSTAIWMHVASGTRGTHDRAGRLAPVMLLGLPLVVLGSSISVTFGGDWRVLPAVIGMNLGVLLVAAGVSSVFSALMPYPATRPGDSPFAQPAVQGSGAGLAQTLSMLVSLVLAVPPVAFSAQVLADPTFSMNIWALLFGTAWGLALLALGIFVGGKVFDRSAPELVALTQTFD